MKASGFALAGAVMTFFGFMHGERIGIGQTPAVAVSYLVVASSSPPAPSSSRSPFAARGHAPPRRTEKRLAV